MAMIICPECGKEISDKSIYCVHCGAPIFVCPECGKVSTGAERTCPNCGYTEKRPEPVVVSVEAQKQEGETIIDFWAREDPQTTTLKKKKWISKVVMSAAFIVLALIAYFCVLKPWCKNVTLENLLNYQKSIAYIWVIATIMLVCALVDQILDTYYSDKNRQCVKWLKASKIDFNSAFWKDMPILFPNGPDGNCTKDDLHEVYYGCFANYKLINVRHLIDFVASLVFSWGLILTFAVSFCNHIRKVVATGIVNYHVKFMEFVPAIAVLGIVLIVLIVYSILASRKIKSYLRAKAKEVNASKKVG